MFSLKTFRNRSGFNKNWLNKERLNFTFSKKNFKIFLYICEMVFFSFFNLMGDRLTEMHGGEITSSVIQFVCLLD